MQSHKYFSILMMTL